MPPGNAKRCAANLFKLGFTTLHKWTACKTALRTIRAAVYESNLLWAAFSYSAEVWHREPYRQTNGFSRLPIRIEISQTFKSGKGEKRVYLRFSVFAAKQRHGRFVFAPVQIDIAFSNIYVPWQCLIFLNGTGRKLTCILWVELSELTSKRGLV